VEQLRGILLSRGACFHLRRADGWQRRAISASRRGAPESGM
jgi:hypothetical protein